MKPYPFLLILIFSIFSSALVALTIPRSINVNDKHPEIEAQRLFDVCRNNSPNSQCYFTEFKPLAKKHDLVFAKKTLYALQNLDENIKACHSIAHTISLSAIEKDPENWEQLFNNQDPEECSGGFYHGILEGHARYDSSFQISGEEITNICTGKSNSYIEGSCVHIFGHILLVESNNDLKEALEKCSKINSKETAQCYSGVFMENMTRENLKEHGLATQFNWTIESAKDYEKLCDNFSYAQAKACWGEMGYMYSAIYNDDPTIVLQQCRRAGNDEFIGKCYFNATAKIPQTSNNQLFVNSICQAYITNPQFFPTNEDPMDYCMSRVINALLSTSLTFFEKANSFCSSFNLKESENCFQIIGRNLSEKIELVEQEKLCQKAPENMQKQCTTRS